MSLLDAMVAKSDAPILRDYVTVNPSATAPAVATDGEVVNTIEFKSSACTYDNESDLVHDV